MRENGRKNRKREKEGGTADDEGRENKGLRLGEGTVLLCRRGRGVSGAVFWDADSLGGRIKGVPVLSGAPELSLRL